MALLLLFLYIPIYPWDTIDVLKRHLDLDKILFLEWIYLTVSYKTSIYFLFELFLLI